MRNSINMCAFAASGPHCQCAPRSPEYKCKRASACPGHLFAASDLSKYHNAGAGFPVNGQCANVISGSAGCASAFAEHCYAASGRCTIDQSEHALA